LEGPGRGALCAINVLARQAAVGDLVGVRCVSSGSFINALQVRAIPAVMNGASDLWWRCRAQGRRTRSTGVAQLPLDAAVEVEDVRNRLTLPTGRLELAHTARPVAHRSLHDSAAGVVENTATAAPRAAIEAGLHRCDVRGRPTARPSSSTISPSNGWRGPRLDPDRSRTTRVTRATDDAYLPFRLSRPVGGRVPVLVEIKEPTRRRPALARRVADPARTRGPIAVMSFDETIVAALDGSCRATRAASSPWPITATTNGTCSCGAQRSFSRPPAYGRSQPVSSRHVTDLHPVPNLARHFACRC
jgi:hypothetical protein